MNPKYLKVVKLALWDHEILEHIICMTGNALLSIYEVDTHFFQVKEIPFL